MTSFSKEERQILLKLARSTISASLSEKGQIEKPAQLPPSLQQKRGCFVTLHKHGTLRGCIGIIDAIYPLIDAVERNARNAAFSDPRFPAVTEDELENINVEISVLTSPQALHFETPEELLDQLKPGIHGVILSLGHHSATFLPQVWEQLPKKEKFLSSLCLKGGMAQDAWRDSKIDVKVYEVEHFPE